jgi:TPR repeat protein
MSTNEPYDTDCHLIKENDEDYLIEMINKKHIFGITKNQYDLAFLKKLYKLLIEDFIDLEDTDTNYIKQIGNYYKGKEDFENMKKYYLLAIEKGDAGAMNNLAIYYQNQKDYDTMLKYYLMAIEKKDKNAMNNLSNYYKKIGDNENMIKICEMFANEGDIAAMFKLSSYYEEQEDYDNMKKYYLMAIDKGDTNAIYNLGLYYKNIKDYDNMNKYYSLAIQKGNSSAMYSLGLYYKKLEDYENMKKYFLMAIEKGHTSAKNEYDAFNDKIIIPRKELIDQFIKITNNFMNEKEASAVIVLLVNNIGYLINKEITYLFDESDKNTLLALQIINKYAEIKKITTDDVKFIFNENLEEIKNINQKNKLNYDKDLKILLKNESDKEKLKRKIEIDRQNKIKQEKETIILINEELNYQKLLANAVKISNWTELNKQKARRDYFIDILERDYPHVLPRLTRLPNLDFSSGCSQYEILPQKVFIINGEFKFTYMYDDAINNLSV